MARAEIKGEKHGREAWEGNKRERVGKGEFCPLARAPAAAHVLNWASEQSRQRHSGSLQSQTHCIRKQVTQIDQYHKQVLSALSTNIIVDSIV